MTFNRALANKARMIDVTGQTFNRLTATEKNIKSGWNCICICGNKLFGIPLDKLKSGNTKSCGCLQKEKASASITKILHSKRKAAGLTCSDKLSDVRQIERAKFKPTRDACFTRDSYTCVWCSTVGGDLNAHHLSPWTTHPELRFEISNVVTLCRTCHYAAHSYNYHGELDVYMNILLQGYIKAVCVRKELT